MRSLLEGERWTWCYVHKAAGELARVFRAFNQRDADPLKELARGFRSSAKITIDKHDNQQIKGIRLVRHSDAKSYRTERRPCGRFLRRRDSSESDAANLARLMNNKTIAGIVIPDSKLIWGKPETISGGIPWTIDGQETLVVLWRSID
jgi:hypothetical protein